MGYTRVRRNKEQDNMENQATDASRPDRWSNKWIFILAATGSAVGLGNIWRFPYIAGENGGGAFVITYLVSVLLIGIPIMMSEVLLGREGRSSPITTMRRLIEFSKANRIWVLIGWVGVLTGFLILSYYEVIAGWALNYSVTYAGQLTGMIPVPEVDLSTGMGVAETQWNALLANPWELILFQTIFIAITVVAIGRGVKKGLEFINLWFMPSLFLLLLALLVYSILEGDMQAALTYMFKPDWSALGAGGAVAAMGQAFFTLSLGMGAIMVYGSYLPSEASIPRAVLSIATLDTLVAVVAGLIVFSIVFANGLEPAAGPGLLFISLSHAFHIMPNGLLFGMLFFSLVTVAALTSLISISEPALAWLVEEYNARRERVAITIGVVAWILGLGTIFSFNEWENMHIVGDLTFFDLLDQVTNEVLLPLGGLFIALFTGWVLPKEIAQRQLSMGNFSLQCWYLATRYLAPAGVLLVFAHSIYERLS